MRTNGIEVYYCHHCDDECGLGQAWYDCPVCGKLQIDGDLFMRWIVAYTPQVFTCACGAELEELHE